MASASGSDLSIELGATVHLPRQVRLQQCVELQSVGEILEISCRPLP